MRELLEKQFDPRMHSAEHIVNRTMIRMFRSGRCFSAHIERKKSKLDYHFARTLTQKEIDELARQVNDIIQADFHVTEEFVPRDDAERQYNLERLPEDAGDHIRQSQCRYR